MHTVKLYLNILSISVLQDKSGLLRSCVLIVKILLSETQDKLTVSVDCNFKKLTQIQLGLIASHPIVTFKLILHTKRKKTRIDVQNCLRHTLFQSRY